MGRAVAAFSLVWIVVEGGGIFGEKATTGTDMQHQQQRKTAEIKQVIVRLVLAIVVYSLIASRCEEDWKELLIERTVRSRL